MRNPTFNMKGDKKENARGKWVKQACEQVIKDFVKSDYQVPGFDDLSYFLYLAGFLRFTFPQVYKATTRLCTKKDTLTNDQVALVIQGLCRSDLEEFTVKNFLEELSDEIEKRSTMVENRLEMHDYCELMLDLSCYGVTKSLYISRMAARVLIAHKESQDTLAAQNSNFSYPFSDVVDAYPDVFCSRVQLLCHLAALLADCPIPGPVEMLVETATEMVRNLCQEEERINNAIILKNTD